LLILKKNIARLEESNMTSEIATGI